ncbi:MAG: fatty acid desaturase family protein, partial [Thermoanaerobaculia bacterium]
RTLLRDVTGLGQAQSSITLMKYAWSAKRKHQGKSIAGGYRKHVVRIALLHATVIAVATATGTLPVYLLLWIVPNFTLNLALYRVRGGAEHCALAPNELRYTRDTLDPLLTTRTVVANPFMKAFAVPHNVSYHLEHHLFPSVPFFRLQALHERLMKQPEYRERAHITHGHRALVRELTSDIETPPAMRRPLTESRAVS